MLFVVLILMQPFAVLRIPAAPSKIPSSGILVRQLAASAHLRYRIEVVECYI